MAAETQWWRSQAKRRRTTSREPQGRWADLPTDVLLSVAYAASYPSSSLYAAVGHVCTRWRAAIASSRPPGTFPRQLPVLALQPLPATSTREHTTGFPEGWEDLPYGIPRVVESGISGVVGSCHGWLVVLDPDAAHLAVRNPTTGHAIHFPSLRPLIASSSSSSSAAQAPDVDVHRVIVSHDPALHKDFIVLLFLAGVTTRCFTFRGGAGAWAAHAHREFHVEDVVFFSGRFVAVDKENSLAVFDWQANDSGDHLSMTTCRLEPRMLQPQRTPVSSYGSVFLVELSGSLLVATVWCDRTGPRGERPPEVRETGRSKQILEVDFSGDSGAALVANERLNLGGHAVFLGHGNSVAVAGAHFPALGTDVIFCLVKRRTVVYTKHSKKQMTQGAILISPYNPLVKDDSGTAIPVESEVGCEWRITPFRPHEAAAHFARSGARKKPALQESKEPPAKVWSGQLRPLWVVPNLLGVESRKKKRISTAFYDIYI